MIQSVDRAVRILFALQGARRMTLSELAAELELAPTTVHGIVRTLAAHGVVVQERDGGRYRLGPAVLRFGNVYLDSLDLRARSLAWAHELARQSGLAVRVGVLLGEEAVVIHHEPRPDGSRQMPEVGAEIPAHASALGKAMLAFGGLPDDLELRSMTGTTVTSRDLLAEQLGVTRDSGIAYECDEAVLGESGVAGAIFDRAGIAGAVAVVIPTLDWPASDAVVDMVRTTARTISRELGAVQWPGVAAP